MELIASPVRAEVAGVLSRADAGFTGRQLERMVRRHSHGAVVAALRRLVDEGLVTQEPAGQAFLYRLNRQHLAAAAVLELATMRLRLFDLLRSLIEAWEVQPVSAVVFGSVARGEATAASDLDVLVVRPTSVDGSDDIWRDQIRAFEQAATAATGNDARVLEWEEENLPKAAGREPVIDDAIVEGIPLVGTSLHLLRVRAARAERRRAEE